MTPPCRRRSLLTQCLKLWPVLDQVRRSRLEREVAT